MDYINSEFYRQLVNDYVKYGEDSIVFTHYENELRGYIHRQKNKDGTKTGKKMPVMAELYGAFHFLKKAKNENYTFQFITRLFNAFSDHPELYDHAMSVRKSIKKKKKKNEEEKKEKKPNLNEESDFSDIVDSLWPFISVPLELGENEKEGIIKKGKKTLVREKVAETAEYIRSKPREAKAKYKSKGLLVFGKEHERLFKQVLKRNIDKSFKDYLYTNGYYFYREQTEKRSICRLEKLPEGKGRSGMKTDRTLKFLSEICKKKNILSITGGNIDSPEFRSMMEELYKDINQKYNDDYADISFVVAVDPHTGVSWQLLGKSYLKKADGACAYAVFSRNEENTMTAKSASGLQYTVSDEDVFDDKDASDAFTFAREHYMEKVEEVLDEMRDSNEDYYNKLVAEVKKDILDSYGFVMHEDEDGDELFNDTMNYVTEAYEDED